MTSPIESRVMAPSAPNLDTLPVELIRRIASKAEFMDTVALMQTCLTLRDACSDWTVFQKHECLQCLTREAGM
ncbi:hypothetical protein K402DRAFT_388841 [Aulographum hederae CBS 113979]|uniref:Uncharacterized protein n=1 Tax=Aulographum hederae CBS 113979 TaxID=1176131 RepID=A0A6G1HE44_9PEZI|nr:hypothetical protein K402DRAFT_388841 [Aulographum hederae CBS 113979]